MIISFLRTVLLYLFILFAMRIMGKRQISEMQPSELVVTLLVSNIASIPMQNPSLPLVSGLIPIIVLIAFEILVSLYMMKNSKFRNLLCGKPAIIIEKGKINQNMMHKIRMSTEDLIEQLRQLNVFSLKDIDYAIVETNGTLSILKKPEKEQPTISDLKLKSEKTPIEGLIISNGDISEFSLNLCGLDEKWVEKILKEENLKLENIFIMTANENKEYNIIKKEELK